MSLKYNFYKFFLILSKPQLHQQIADRLAVLQVGGELGFVERLGGGEQQRFENAQLLAPIGGRQRRDIRRQWTQRWPGTLRCRRAHLGLGGRLSFLVTRHVVVCCDTQPGWNHHSPLACRRPTHEAPARRALS